MVETEKYTKEIKMIDVTTDEGTASIRRDNLVAVLKSVKRSINGNYKPIKSGTVNSVANALCKIGILERNYSGGGMSGEPREFAGYATTDERAMELLKEIGEIKKEYHIKPRHGEKTTFEELENAEQKKKELEQRNKDINYKIQVEEEIV